MGSTLPSQLPTKLVSWITAVTSFSSESVTAEMSNESVTSVMINESVTLKEWRRERESYT